MAGPLLAQVHMLLLHPSSQLLPAAASGDANSTVIPVLLAWALSAMYQVWLFC
jgi:hypothetical protein